MITTPYKVRLTAVLVPLQLDAETLIWVDASPDAEEICTVLVPCPLTIVAKVPVTLQL